MSTPKTYIVDIDGILCTNTDGEYNSAKPVKENINKINELYHMGYRIILWTARGSTTGIDWRELTAIQMGLWGVKHHELRMGKPHYDKWIDDKSENWAAPVLH